MVWNFRTVPPEYPELPVGFCSWVPSCNFTIGVFVDDHQEVWRRIHKPTVDQQLGSKSFICNVEIDKLVNLM